MYVYVCVYMYLRMSYIKKHRLKKPSRDTNVLNNVNPNQYLRNTITSMCSYRYFCQTDKKRFEYEKLKKKNDLTRPILEIMS